MITQTRLKELLNYDPDTGTFTRNVSRGRFVSGTIVGTTDSLGYRRIYVDGHSYIAHRLAWLYMSGEWPRHNIDHKNGNRSDNRIANIRSATSSQNSANKKTMRNGLKGCSYDRGKWKAQISKSYKSIHVGYFDTEQEAHDAYMEAAKKLHGEFARAA